MHSNYDAHEMMMRLLSPLLLTKDDNDEDEDEDEDKDEDEEDAHWVRGCSPKFLQSLSMKRRCLCLKSNFWFIPLKEEEKNGKGILSVHSCLKRLPEEL